jgi:ABC-type amino acid transport substrate-binding protein
MKKILAMLFASILLFTGCNASPDMSLAIIEKSGYFIAGYDPENYHTLEGYGLAVDVIKAAGERMGLRAPIYPVTSYDWSTHLKNSKIDMMLCANTTEDLQTIEVFSDNIIVLKQKEKEITTVGVIDSEKCIEAMNKFAGMDTECKYKYYSDGALLLNDLSTGALDGAILSEYDTKIITNISDYDMEVLSSTPVTFVVSKGSATFYSKLNNILTQMVSDGTINRLKEGYLKPSTN